MNLPFTVDLNDRIAVVTGGGGVLCSEFAMALAMCGAKVAILDLKEEAADAVAKKIYEAGGTAIGVKADVLSKESLEKAKEEVISRLGACDLLINGAGGNHPGGTTAKEYFFPGDLDGDFTTFFNLEPEKVKFVFDLNFTGAMLTTQVFARDMVNMQNKPSIINISSMNAFKPLTKIPAYSAAKSAVSNFTMWLAVHFAKVNIRVNAIAPGFFLTEQNRNLLTNQDGTPTERAAKIIAHTPMGRFGKSDELIGTLLWLADNDASGFVNGIVVPVDGGFSAYSGV